MVIMIAINTKYYSIDKIKEILEDDIPEFISNEDLLSRYLSIKDVIASAIYKTDGTLIARLEKENIIKHK